MLIVIEDVSNGSVRDFIDDVKDTRKIGVSLVHEVDRDLVVLGLGVVDFGNDLSLRRLKYTHWCDFGAIEDFPHVFSLFYIDF